MSPTDGAANGKRTRELTVSLVGTTAPPVGIETDTATGARSSTGNISPWKRNTTVYTPVRG